MRRAFLGLGAAIVIAAVPGATYASNEDGAVAGLKGVPVHGTTAIGDFNALLDVERFVTRNNTVCAIGVLHDVTVGGKSRPNARVALPVQGAGTGNCNPNDRDRDGDDGDDGPRGGFGALDPNLFTRPASLTGAPSPLIIQAQTCPILRLVLGPLDLNLLGLRVQLNQVVLVITANAQQGLLGALLCAVANLLAGFNLNLAALLAALLNAIANLLTTAAAI